MNSPPCQIITANTDIQNVDFQSGAAVLVDKEKNWTSFDLVAKLRNRLSKRYQVKRFKVGHAGTLDPLATGLVIICTGKATKLIESFQAQHKSYDAVIKLGATTRSYDAEKEEENIKQIGHINESMISDKIKSFTGLIQQTPPIYSALKVGGKALYKYARQNKEVEIKSRAVTVHDFKIANYNPPFIECSINCSKGTYIRSLAHDLGQALACGGYLSDLRRTAIGEYNVNESLNIQDIVQSLDELI